MTTLPYKLIQSRKARGFTLIELLVVILISGILATISLPIVLKQVDKARIAEAKNILGIVNRAQQSYYFQKVVFANSLDALGIELKVGSYNGSTYETEFYQYLINEIPTDTEVHHLALPRTKYEQDINKVASAVFRTGLAFTNIVCEANTTDPLLTLQIPTPTTCTNGTIIH